ncbi:hypothetical protein ACQEVF_22780 [Nonomuraea polychroma]|uniref:hypothetical protein n=1 Tax=Nonomuraea polychroma TaxID=46176 RepID=UPI003D8F310D
MPVTNPMKAARPRTALVDKSRMFLLLPLAMPERVQNNSIEGEGELVSQRGELCGVPAQPLHPAVRGVRFDLPRQRERRLELRSGVSRYYQCA